MDAVVAFGSAVAAPGSAGEAPGGLLLGDDAELAARSWTPSPCPGQPSRVSGSAGEAPGSLRPLVDRSRSSGDPCQLSPRRRLLGHLEHAARAHAVGLRQMPEMVQDALQEVQVVVGVDADVTRVPPQMIDRA